MVLSPWCLHSWVQQECSSHSDPTASREWNCLWEQIKRRASSFSFFQQERESISISLVKGWWGGWNKQGCELIMLTFITWKWRREWMKETENKDFRSCCAQVFCLTPMTSERTQLLIIGLYAKILSWFRIYIRFTMSVWSIAEETNRNSLPLKTVCDFICNRSSDTDTVVFLRHELLTLCVGQPDLLNQGIAISWLSILQIAL